jgi:hypothetical protein
MKLTREQLIQKLQKSYPEMQCRLTEDFNGVEGGVWLSGESGIEDRKGMPLFNYYAQDSHNSRPSYIFGVRYHLHNFLERNGWYAEWNDPGTIMLWEV